MEDLYRFFKSSPVGKLVLVGLARLYSLLPRRLQDADFRKEILIYWFISFLPMMFINGIIVLLFGYDSIMLRITGTLTMLALLPFFALCLFATLGIFLMAAMGPIALLGHAISTLTFLFKEQDLRGRPIAVFGKPIIEFIGCLVFAVLSAFVAYYYFFEVITELPEVVLGYYYMIREIAIDGLS